MGIIHIGTPFGLGFLAFSELLKKHKMPFLNSSSARFNRSPNKNMPACLTVQGMMRQSGIFVNLLTMDAGLSLPQL
jgi:hypothetical protein